MKTFELRRLYQDETLTLGLLFFEGKPQLTVLEPPWRENYQMISCIPTGTYEATRLKHVKFGETLLIENVPGRSGIYLHIGNYVDDTLGCPLVGMCFDMRHERPMISSSKFAMNHLRSLFDTESKFNFAIHNTL